MTLALFTLVASLSFELALAGFAQPVKVFPDGACTQASTFDEIVPDTLGCTNLPTSGQFGAFVPLLPNKEGCIIKFWEESDCHGLATTHGQSNEPCIPIANQGNGDFHLENGAASFMVVCLSVVLGE